MHISLNRAAAVKGLEDDMSTIRNRIPEKVRRFIYVAFLSMLPGILISLLLFINALYHDIRQQNERNALPDTDLSAVRIEGRAIDDDNPRISMAYPATPKFDWDEDSGKETWRKLTIDGVPMPNYETALEMLGGTHNMMDGTRPLEPYSSFLDRTNNIELRFGYNPSGEIHIVSLMRIDSRDTFVFLAQRKLLSYDERGLPVGAGNGSVYDDALTDYGHVYGPKLFSHWEPLSIANRINDVFRAKRFLFYIREYFYIPLYGATWVFPLLWMTKIRSQWGLLFLAWYPLWWIFCGLTYLALQ
jgi:hypothetical protein